MGDQKPSLADIVSAMFNPNAPAPTNVVVQEPSDSPVAPPPQAKQISAPTAAELKEVQELADQAAELYDEIEELVGAKTAELAAKKTALRERMLGHGLKEVTVAGRPAIALATKRDKEVTKKAITGLLGVEETAKLWNNLPVKTSHYISIPPRTPPGS